MLLETRRDHQDKLSLSTSAPTTRLMLPRPHPESESHLRSWLTPRLLLLLPLLERRELDPSSLLPRNQRQRSQRLPRKLRSLLPKSQLLRSQRLQRSPLPRNQRLPRNQLLRSQQRKLLQRRSKCNIYLSESLKMAFIKALI